MIKVCKEFLLSKILTYILSQEEVRDAVSKILQEEFSNISLNTPRVWGLKERLFLGENVQLNDATINTVSGNIYIGDNTFLGHGVSILTGTHDFRYKGIERQVKVPEQGRDIIIGKGVWIASNVVILAPCEIKDNSVIAANTIVTGTVEENELVATTRDLIRKKINFNKS